MSLPPPIMDGSLLRIPFIGKRAVEAAAASLEKALTGPRLCSNLGVTPSIRRATTEAVKLSFNNNLVPVVLLILYSFFLRYFYEPYTPMLLKKTVTNDGDVYGKR